MVLIHVQVRSFLRLRTRRYLVQARTLHIFKHTQSQHLKEEEDLAAILVMLPSDLESM